jgi:hypothetical protein
MVAIYASPEENHDALLSLDEMHGGLSLVENSGRS